MWVGGWGGQAEEPVPPGAGPAPHRVPGLDETGGRISHGSPTVTLTGKARGRPCPLVGTPSETHTHPPFGSARPVSSELLGLTRVSVFSPPHFPSVLWRGRATPHRSPPPFRTEFAGRCRPSSAASFRAPPDVYPCPRGMAAPLPCRASRCKPVPLFCCVQQRWDRWVGWLALFPNGDLDLNGLRSVF